MRFDTGIHPRQWHRGAWLLAFLIAALGLLLTHRPTGGVAAAMDLSSQSGTPAPPPVEETTPPPVVKGLPVEGEEPAITTAPARPAAGSADGFVAEIVDSSFTVGPAEFFALDLPVNKGNARAVHLFGTVSTRGHKDIIVRLFRSPDYDLWLKQKSGKKAQAFWTSPRAASFTVDQDLPAGPVVLLLDNGYSIRTPKKVICQLQLRYVRNPTETFDTAGSGSTVGSGETKTAAPEDNLPTPRSNSDQEMPPPPPPPPSGY